MRGQWNGLQSLFIKECSSAYYVHCFVHQLQLALVAASKEVVVIWLFFSALGSIVNVITTSPRRHTQLQVAHTVNIEELVGTGELETGRGANQIGTIPRLGATHWGSHYDSVFDLIHMYDASCTVLENIKNDKFATHSLRGEANGVYNAIRSFEFTFILHLLQEIMGITDILCRELQNKSQDILNAMNLVITTKDVLQKLRLDGWATFIDKVSLFCKKHDVDMPDMNAQYKVGTGRSCQQTDHITFEHHYHIDIFNNAIDFQLVELNSRFSEEAMELLNLSSALEPREAFKAFNIYHICKLSKKFYPLDFTEKELHTLRCKLKIYESGVPHHLVFQKMSTTSELCRGLVETKRSERYYLIDRLIRLVLTLPVSIATTKRAFSAMNLIKTRLRNKMESEVLTNSMVVYIEKELAKKIDSEEITKDFNSIKD